MPLKQGKILAPSHCIVSVSENPENVFLLGLFGPPVPYVDHPWPAEGTSDATTKL